MATMYPQRLPATIQSNAERKLYNALRDNLPPSYTVIWSIPWTVRRSPADGGGAVDGEVDFLLLHPQKGILNIEVKGGGVGYDGSRHEWYTINRFGQRSVIDPFDQATKCMHTMLKKLKNEAASPVVRKSCQKAVFGRAVFFPDIAASQVANRPIIPDDFVLCREALEHFNLEAELDRVYQYWQRTGTQPIGPKVIDEIVAMYAPSWYIKPPMINRLEEEEAQLRELTERQFTALDLVSTRKRFAISGCAGSGKTFLAVEQARRLARRGYKVLLTCYNRNLSDWLRKQLTEQAQEESALEKIDTLNFHRVAYRLCERAGVPLPASEGRNYDGDFAEGLLEATEKVPEQRYDVIIADEGQDFDDGWWVALLSLLKDEWESHLYIFFDNNQRIYRRGSAYPIEQSNFFTLNTNCRTTKKIHAEMLKYYPEDDDRPDCKGPTGEDIERFPVVPGSPAERTKLAELLKHLVETEKIPTDEIVILSSSNKDSTRFKDGSIGSKYRLSWNMEGVPLSNTITCCSIYAFKGLERMVVILVEPEKIQGDREAEQLAYVALSRAKLRLYILGNL